MPTLTVTCNDRELASSSAVSCLVQSLASLKTDQVGLAALRRNPGTFPGLPISPTLFKYADDQTVLALVAVLRAAAKLGRKPEEYHGWGVLAASSFFGRAFSAHALQKYVREGAWGITPHMVPHHSLHAISGTISQAFHIQGPNFGVGGGPQAHAEGMIAAASLMAEGAIPGLWLVLTGHHPEQVPDETEEPTNSPCECLALALALAPDDPLTPGPRLLIDPGAPSNLLRHFFSLADFVMHLGEPPSAQRRTWELNCGGAVEWLGE